MLFVEGRLSTYKILFPTNNSSSFYTNPEILMKSETEAKKNKNTLGGIHTKTELAKWESYNACHNSWNTLSNFSNFHFSASPPPSTKLGYCVVSYKSLGNFQNTPQQCLNFKQHIVLGGGLFSAPKSCLGKRSYEEEILLRSQLVSVAFQLSLVMIVGKLIS